MRHEFWLLNIFWILTYAQENLEQPPNIVIIMADDMGFDDVSFHGAKQHLTPNIDALAYNGMILQNLYAPPCCTPSRSAFMTGRYPIRTGTQHAVLLNEDTKTALPENETTIAEVLKTAGYSTNMIGKWNLGFAEKKMLPTSRGFDTYYGYLGGFVDYYKRGFQNLESNSSWGYDFRRNLNVECENSGQYLTDVFTQEAESIIEKHDKNKPLFLLVNHLAAHAGSVDEPLQAPAEEIAKFEYIKDRKKRIFAAMVSKLDESVGSIIKALENKCILNNTIIIFYSDNGAPSVGYLANTGSNYPMRGQKNTPFEGGVHVAGAIWSPLLRKRKTIFRQNMYVGDFLPTLASAANIELGSGFDLDGLDLWEQLSSGTQQTFDREILHMLDDIWGVTSYMNGNFKYINGTTFNGFASGYVSNRHPYEEDPRNSLYAQSVLNSMSGKILAKYNKIPLTFSKVNAIRKSAEIKCNSSKDIPNCNPLIEECLFRVDKDPCEQKNLAKANEYKNILTEMRKSIANYRAAIVPSVTNNLNEQLSNPGIHNCLWTWFLEEQPTGYIQNCSVKTACQSTKI